jgi:hypothetical protein
MRYVIRTALVIPLIILCGCVSGGTNSKIKVSKHFLDGLIEEQDTISQCCPFTATVVSDWIVQNEP